MSAPDKPLTANEMREALAAAAAMTGGLASYQCLAIVGALAEARVLDPNAVAKWADFWAAAIASASPAETYQAIREGLMGFAGVIRGMATRPEGSGTA